jgi:hypothetical protein
MSNCLINTTHFPIVLITIEGNVSNENVDLIIMKWTQLYKENKDFFYICNFKELNNINFKEIYKLIKFIKKIKK